MKSNAHVRAILALALAATTLFGCAAATEETAPVMVTETAPDGRIATVDASPTTRESVGIARWDVVQDGASTSLRGLAGDGTLMWNVRVVREDGDEEHVDLVATYPQSGSVTLVRDGKIGDRGGSSKEFLRVAAAIRADLGSGNTREQSGSVTPSTDLAPKALYPWALNKADTLFLGWNMWGYQFDVVVGNPVCNFQQTRTHNMAGIVNGMGKCSATWYTNDNRDCRIMLHAEQFGSRVGTCRWEVYQNEDR
jgi:hypothetical protein